MKKPKICIVGLGYVGTAMAVLLAQKNEVMAYDINQEKVDKINKKISPIKDSKISNYLKKPKLRIQATTDKIEAYENADYIIISTPTNFDAKQNSFDTSSLDKCLKDIHSLNKKALIIIKSTVPIGYTDIKRKKYSNKIIFSPEFLREGKALQDNLYPTRLIFGDNSVETKKFSVILKNSCLKKNIKVLFISSKEAEAVKLFSNSYLAMRISFFNELDSFSLSNNLETKNIIEGIILDPRIGDDYNNPSFGFGGYCLPKDSKQLLTDFKTIPQSIISSINKSNKKRKKYISDEILKLNPKKIGIYRLAMKQGSDNFRESSILDIINYLKSKKVKLLIYDPNLKMSHFGKINFYKMLKQKSFQEIYMVLIK